jgi:hypothetical protein
MRSVKAGYAFVRDVYGLTVPVVLLAVTLFCMIFLREASLVIIVLPCAALLILTLIAAYFILGSGDTRSPTEESLFRLLASGEGTGRFTLPEIAQSLKNAAPDQIAEALSHIYSSALLSLFWDKESGTIFLPGQDICPKCGAKIDPARTHGNCWKCGTAYAVSDRKKPFRRL